MSIAAPVLAIVGSVVSGAASGWMAKEERKAEEEAQIAEEKRREERYRGIGEAAQVGEGDVDPEAEYRENSQVGSRAPQMGDKYRFGDDRRTGQRGLGDRSRLQKPMGMPQSSVQQGAAPIMQGQQRTTPGAQLQKAQTAAAPAKPRYSYNPQSGRIEIAQPGA